MPHERHMNVKVRMNGSGEVVEVPQEEAKQMIFLGVALPFCPEIETAALTPDGGRMQSRVRPLPSACACKRKRCNGTH